MKKLLLIIFLLPIALYGQLQLPYAYKNISVPAAPSDYYYYNGTSPYTTPTQVTTIVTSTERYRGQTFNVAGVEYWFKDGITNGDLVTKGGGGAWGTITGTLSAQTDLQTALNSKLTAIIASPSTGQLLRFNGTNWVNVSLVSGDIPSLDASKITTGTLPDARIASAATWNAKENTIVAGTGLTRSVNTLAVNTSQNITTLSNLTTTGVVKSTSGGVLSSALVADADIATGTISNSKLANSAVANLSGTNTGDNAVNSLYSGLVGNATHTGDVTGATVLTLATVNSNVGTFNGITVNEKGLVTAASALTNASTSTTGLLTATDWNTFNNKLSATGSASGLTGFPILNQNTTGTASNVTGTVAVANGGTGATTASGARTNLGIGTIGTLNALASSNIPLTVNQIAFGSATNTQTSSNELTWDNTTKVLGINGGVVNFDDLNNNTAIGISSLTSNTTGTENTAIGNYSLISNTTGTENTAIGNYSLISNITGNNNTAIGNFSLSSNTTGNYNTAFGNYSLSSNTTGNSNTAFGNSSLSSNTTGNSNIGIGNNCSTTSPTTSNQLVIGSNTAPITTAYIGKGGTNPATSSYTVNSVLFAVSQAKGTNQESGDFVLGAGQGTGTGAAGKIVLQTASTGTTGAVVNPLVTRATIGTSLDLNSGLEQRFYNTGNTFYTGLKAGSNTANTSLILPISDGTNGQVLQTNGAGQLSFASVSGGGGGSVTSVGGTGTVSGISLSGTVTSTGNLTLGGTLSVAPSNFASQTANTVLAAPNGSAGVPTFRTLVSADIPTLNQNTTGNAATVTTNANLTGVVTSAGNVTSIASGAITNAMLANGAVANLSGINTGDNATNSQYSGLVSNATHTGDVTGATALTIANSAVTYAKMQNITTARIMGRLTAGSGVMEELTGTQATSLLDNFTSTTKGLVPLSGGGTTNFLRADGTWAAPPAGGGGGSTPAGSTGQIQFNNGGAFGASGNLTWSGTTLTASELATTGYFKIIHAINSGGGLYNEVGGVNMMQMGFNNQASYGGVINTTSGRQFFVYDFPTSSYRMGFNSNGDMFVGSSSTVFTARLGNAGNMFRSSAVSIPTFVAQGISSQTANLIEFQNSSGTALAAFSPSGNLEFSSGIKGIRHNGVGVLDFAGTTGSTKGLLLSATSTSARLETSGHLELQGGGGGNNVRSMSTLDFGSTGAGGSITTAGVATFGDINERVGTGGAIAKVGGVLKTYTTTTTIGNGVTTPVSYFTYTIPANSLTVNGDEISFDFGIRMPGGGGAYSYKSYITFNGTELVSLEKNTSGGQSATLKARIVRKSNTDAIIICESNNFSNTVFSYKTSEMNGLDFTTNQNIVAIMQDNEPGFVKTQGLFAKVKYEPANP